MNLFDVLLCQPLLNALMLIYQYLPGRDFGLAVIVFTALIRLLLYPLVAESIRVQKITTDLQPKIKEIQTKYKNDKEKQAALIMALWKDNKVNPFNGFMLVLIQLPVLFALYSVFRKGLNAQALSGLYSFVPNPGAIDPHFLGVNLAAGSLLMAAVAGVLQFVQTKMMTNVSKPAGNAASSDPMEKFSSTMQNYTLYFMPVLTVFIFWRLPAVLSLYWIVTSLFSIAQQYFIFKKMKPTA